MEKENRAKIEVTILSDGTALVDIPKGLMPNHETLVRVCDMIKRKRREMMQK